MLLFISKIKSLILLTTKEKIVTKICLEIRPGEGGEDAKLLVSDQTAIYCKFAERVGARVEVETEHG